jgi:hypothetical protein
MFGRWPAVLRPLASCAVVRPSSSAMAMMTRPAWTSRLAVRSPSVCSVPSPFIPVRALALASGPRSPARRPDSLDIESELPAGSEDDGTTEVKRPPAASDEEIARYQAKDTPTSSLASTYAVCHPPFCPLSVV